MADGSGGGAGMGMMVGALAVVVVIIGGVVLMGGGLTSHKTIDLNVHAPSMPVSAPAAPTH
ncbi:MAG TPA: hypothetical protein VHW60_23440 [Caulobacteraceae bacterium]|nr:hypothetical protein [Caulobacteraceae bacterium]